MRQTACVHYPSVLNKATFAGTELKGVRRADATICNKRPVKSACTKSDRGRMIHRSLYADYLDTVRGYRSPETYQKAMSKRQVWVEPLFSKAKEWHGFCRLRLGGLLNANIQERLIAAGQNLKRFLSATCWGRRHASSGRFMAVPMGPQALSAAFR